jgi:uncharacterized protein
MNAEHVVVQVEEKDHRGAFYIEREGLRLAELAFSATPDRTLAILDHTEVSDSLRGQGIARKLVEAAVAWARQTKVKLVPLCPVAKALFDREPNFEDVRA